MPGIPLKTLKKCNTSNNFFISGELGDIIYSLPSLKTFNGCILYIGGEYKEFPNEKILSQNDVNQLSEILVQQPYIKNVFYTETQPKNSINLNHFKKRYIDWKNELLSLGEGDILRRTCLTNLFAELLNVDIDNKSQWLRNKNISSTQNNLIVINRTLRYTNDEFPWEEIVKYYNKNILFAGLDYEYKDFCEKFGEVQYCKTDSLLDFYNLISKCQVYIGNQSFGYALAEGLKKDCIQETDKWMGNCQYIRNNSLIFKDGENNNFNQIKEFLDQRNISELKTNSVYVNGHVKKIFYIGQSGTSGYAKAAKGYIYDFIQRGHHIDWLPLKFDSSSESRTQLDLACKALQISHSEQKYDEIYLHCTPDLWPIYKKTYGETFKDTKVIGYSVWETESLPSSWSSLINENVDLLQVPSEYNKQIYINSGITIPIEIKPHFFHKEILPNKNDINIVSVDGKLLDNNKFTFYNISELNERKGIEDCLYVFDEVYKNNNDVQFLLKTHYKDYTEDNTSYVLDQLSNYINKSNIFVVVKKLSQRELLSFHTVGDCYLSLHRGEAFGLVLHEAYNYGKTIVTTGYGGQNEFLGNDYEYFVDYNLNPVANMDNFNKWYEPSQLWGVPNLEHAKEILRKIQ